MDSAANERNQHNDKKDLQPCGDRVIASIKL